MKNKKLHDAIKNLSFEVAKLLKVKLQTLDNIPTRIEEKIEIKDSSSASFFHIIKIDLGRIFFKNEKEIFESTFAQEVINQLKKDPLINNHLDRLVGVERGSLQIRFTTERCLQRFLLPLLDELEELNWNEEKFEKHYSLLEDAFYIDKIPYRAIASLENFSADFDEVKITDTLKIIKVSKDELQEIWARGKFNPFVNRDKRAYQYVIEMTWEAKKVIGSGNQKPVESMVKNEIGDVLTTLRIFKAGITGFNFIETKPIKPSILIAGIESVGGLATQPYLGGKYTLQSGEGKSLVELFRLLRDAKTHTIPNYLLVAIKRFEYAYARLLPEDKLLDFMVAFEAIFLKGNERQELSYRLSLRAAYLLAENAGERKSIFDFMHKAYNARSEIVHGERATGEGKIKNFVDKVEFYLRLSITKVLKEGQYKKNHNNFLDTLDELILQGR